MWSVPDVGGNQIGADLRGCTSMDVHGLALWDWKSCVGQPTVGSNPPSPPDRFEQLRLFVAPGATH